MKADATAFYQGCLVNVARHLAQELRIKPNVNYRVDRATDGARVLSVALSINPALAPRVISLAEQLSMAARLDAGMTIRIVRGQRGSLVLEVPKPEALWRTIPVAALPRRRGLLASLGLDTSQRPTALNFADALTPHLLIAGASGCGKTNAQKLIAYDLATQNEPAALGLLLLDVSAKRGYGWRPFARLPHLLNPIVTDRDEALRALAWAKAELDRRSSDGRKAPRIFIGIDEAQALLEYPELAKLANDVAATGREFGLHVLAAMQNPTSKQLGGDSSFKRNMACRLVGKVDSADAATVAAGIPDSGAQYLSGSGDMLLIKPGLVQRLAVALVSDQDLARLPVAEEVQRLDLGGIEDPDLIPDAATAEPGRADPIDAAQLAWILANPGLSQRKVYDALKIGFPKIKRLQDFALSLEHELEKLGIFLCNDTGLQSATRNAATDEGAGAA